MTTARDLIKSSLRKLSVLGKGIALSAEDASNGLETLNNMLSSFSAEGAMVFQTTQETFSLSPSKETYTIGTGLDFNTTPPLEIKAAFVTQGDTDYTVTPYDEREYFGISQKTVAGSIPRIYYYKDNFPTAEISFYPVPSGSDSFTWSARKPLTEFATLDTVFAMPEEYKAMITYNLPEWLASEYEREPSATVKKLAILTKKTVTVQNLKNVKNTSSITGIPMRGGSTQYSDHNINSGWFT